MAILLTDRYNIIPLWQLLYLTFTFFTAPKAV